jgi:sensor domain CHASE-containing protein/HPt (histidine-containing phosphotransfer) domain-containing protein
MKLRGKTLLIVSSTLIILLVILYSVSEEVLMNGFSKVELVNVEKDIKRIRDAYSEKINNLSIKAADWAKWDDTYKFVQDGNQDYISSNLTDQSLEDLNLNIMLFVNKDRKVIFSRGYDTHNSKGITIPENTMEKLISDDILLNHSSEESVTAGTVMLPEGPMAIVSRPILTSEGKGPVNGAIIFGRYLDSSEIDNLAQVTHLVLGISKYGNILDPDMKEASGQLSTKATFVKPLSEKIIAGYTLFPDIHGKPALLARIEIPRDVYQQGKLTKIYLISSILLAGFIFGIVILILLEKTVISRVANLEKDVTIIGQKGDHSKRVSFKGKDELAGLGRSINAMLQALENKESEIKNRNREMRLIMNTVQSGLLSINEDFMINPEYSKSVETILGQTDLAEKSYFEALHLDTDSIVKLKEFLDIFRQELIPEKDMAGLNPFEELCVTKGNNVSWLKLRYHIIQRGFGLQKHILVVIEDITEEKALAEKVKLAERENLQLKAIAEDPDLFREFLIEVKQILKHSKEKLKLLSEDMQSRQLVNEVFRDVHTIKGTAASFGLGFVSEIAGKLENNLSCLRESGEITIEIINETENSLETLSNAVNEVTESAKKIIGDEISETSDITLKISLEKLKTISSIINNLLEKELLDHKTAAKLHCEINKQLYKLRSVPARKGLAKALKIVPDLIKKLQKEIVFDFEGADVPLDCELARELNTPLVHLIRNCFDHGIESTDERIEKGKPIEGHVKLSIKDLGNEIPVELSDDGRGIDPQKMRDSAIKKGILSEAEAQNFTDDQLRELIFQPGFSTAEKVSEISGRGVGMDAVLSSVKEKIHGDLSIKSVTGKGTSFTILIHDKNYEEKEQPLPV